MAKIIKISFVEFVHISIKFVGFQKAFVFITFIARNLEYSFKSCNVIKINSREVISSQATGECPATEIKLASHWEDLPVTTDWPLSPPFSLLNLLAVWPLQVQKKHPIFSPVIILFTFYC